MMTYNWNISFTNSSETEQQIAIEKTDGDYILTYEARFLILKPSKDIYLKIISNNTAESILSDKTNSTGVILTGGNEYTFDPLEDSVFSITAKGVADSGTLQISAGRFVLKKETQISKLSK